MSDDVDIKLQIAILSDLHCYLPDPSIKGGSVESFLVVGAPRIPVRQHPVQALLELIESEQLKAHALICPGDLTNKSCQKGLVTAWGHLDEIKRALCSDNLMCTLGNHDIDYKKINAENPFLLPMSTHPDFPIPDGVLKNQFWAEGFTFIEKDNPAALYLLINSVADFNDENSAARGAFNSIRLESLRKQLSSRSEKIDSQLRIAIMHHHPTLHSFMNYSSDDVLSNGDQLLDLLSLNKFKLFIHGHRHQPRLKRCIQNGNGMLIFASGSFSAMLYDIGSTTRNLFHYFTLTKKDSLFKGSVQSWEYNYGNGWSRTSRKSAGIPFEIKFSDMFVDIDPKCFKDYMECESLMKIESKSIYSKFPDFEYYLPDETERIRIDLESKYGVGLKYDENGQVLLMGKIIEGR
jgi:predicted phosphodiesterase